MENKEIKDFIIKCIEEKRYSYINDMEEKYPPCIICRSEYQLSIEENNKTCDLAILMAEKIYF